MQPSEEDDVDDDEGDEQEEAVTAFLSVAVAVEPIGDGCSDDSLRCCAAVANWSCSCCRTAGDGCDGSVFLTSTGPLPLAEGTASEQSRQ